jgi:hypothetical protein
LDDFHTQLETAFPPPAWATVGAAAAAISASVGLYSSAAFTFFIISSPI